MLATAYEDELEQPVRPSSSSPCVPLSRLRRGERGRVAGIRVAAAGEGVHGISADELERRLLEIGFAEGARIEILHEGLIGRDPIVVALDSMRLALRRREASAILVAVDDESVRADQRTR